MKRATNELFLYHTPETALFQKTLAYAQSVSNFVHEVDITKMPLTELQLEELVQSAHCSLREIINEESELFQKNYATAQFDEQDWLKIVHHHPTLLKYAFAALGDKVLVIREPKDVLSLQS